MDGNKAAPPDDQKGRPAPVGRASDEMATPDDHRRSSGEDQPSADAQDMAASERHEPRPPSASGEGKLDPVADDREQAADERDRRADAREQAADERDRRADERNHQADERARAADVRERAANERDRAAEVREQVAHVREQVADERDRMADYRDERANEREVRADDRETRTDAVEHRGRIPFTVQDQRTTEAIARSRSRLEAITAQLDRSEALIQRIKARADRERAAIGRDLEEGKRHRPDGPSRSPDGKSATETAADLRRLCLELAATLAATEDDVADRHEQMASVLPEKADEYRLTAETAREGAKRVRAAADHFRDLP